MELNGCQALRIFFPEQTSGLVENVLPGIGDSKFYAGIAAGMVEEFALSSGKLDNIRVWFNNKVSKPRRVSAARQGIFYVGPVSLKLADCFLNEKRTNSCPG